MIEPLDVPALVSLHLAQTGEAPSAFGRRVANDPRLVSDLLEGRSVGTALVRRIIAAINERSDAPIASEPAGE